MNKKLLAIGCIVLLSFTAFAQSEADFEFKMAEDGSGWSIVKYNGTSAKVTIPSKKDGKPVIFIGGLAFNENKTITSVIIPEGVTGIEDGIVENRGQDSYPRGAFSECEKLSSVKLPSTLKFIGNNAFFNCPNLDSITIPKGTSRIGNSAFSLSGLKSITLPASLTMISDFSFVRCKMLKSIVIPGSVKSIGESAFYGCESLDSVKLSQGTTIIHEGAFAMCSALKEISLPASIEIIDSLAFYSCSSLTTINIPSSVKDVVISGNAFQGCPLNAASLALIKKYSR